MFGGGDGERLVKCVKENGKSSSRRQCVWRIEWNVLVHCAIVVFAMMGGGVCVVFCVMIWEACLWATTRIEAGGVDCNGV